MRPLRSVAYRATPPRVQLLSKHTIHTEALAFKVESRIPPLPITADARSFQQNGPHVPGRQPPVRTKKSHELWARSTQPDDILTALQLRDYKSLTRLVSHWSQNSPDQFRAWLGSLSANTFSELLLSLDPFLVSVHADAAHEIRISSGVAQYCDFGRLNNKYGVRVLYSALLPALVDAFETRIRTQKPVAPSDYKILLRYAGASQDIPAAKQIWNMMEENGHLSWRNVELITEYIMARFLTEPLYFQYDRSRVRVLPRLLHRQKFVIPRPQLQKLDSLRLSINMTKTDAYGRMAGDPFDSTVVQEMLQNKRPIETLWESIVPRCQMDERLFCAGLVAFSRSASRVWMFDLLANHYNVKIQYDPSTGQYSVQGGPTADEKCLAWPTQKLFLAIAEAFGATGDTRIATNLIMHLSNSCGVAIEGHVWSALLEWTYVCASKPHTTEWAIIKSHNPKIRSGDVSTEDVKLVWNLMTSPPYNVVPSWGDLSVYIKILIETVELEEALQVIRIAKNLYDGTGRDYLEASLALGSYTKQTPPPCPPESPVAEQLHSNWQTSKVALRYGHNCLREWLKNWVAKCTAFDHRRTGGDLTTQVPDLVLEFGSFLPSPLHFRTSAGNAYLYLNDTHNDITSKSLASPLSVFGTTSAADLPLDAKLTLTKRVISQPPAVMLRVTAKDRWATPGPGRKMAIAVRHCVRRLVKTPRVRVPMDGLFMAAPAHMPPGQMVIRPDYTGHKPHVAEQKQVRPEALGVTAHALARRSVEWDFGLEPHVPHGGVQGRVWRPFHGEDSSGS